VRPFVARTYPFADIAQAQNDFIAKKYAGKLVLIPPPDRRRPGRPCAHGPSGSRTRANRSRS
jgi:hypothetical protein